MNNLQNKLLILALALAALAQVAAAQSYSELRRSNGATALGVRKDSTTFMTCKGHEITILGTDTVSPTDKTCEEETQNPRCPVCLAPHDVTPTATTKPHITSLIDKTPPDDAKSTKGEATHKKAMPSTTTSTPDAAKDKPAASSEGDEAVASKKAHTMKADTADFASKAKAAAKKQKAAQKD